MSFYQPSLSLYDVLNALNEQASTRGAPPPRGPPPHGHPPHGPPPHGPPPHGPPPHGHPHHHPHPYPPNDLFNPFGGAFDGPFGYFNRMPNQGYYYSPQYDYYDDDDEELDQNMEGEEEEAGEEKQRETRPSYYHGNGPDPRRSYGPVAQGPDYLTDLLNSLIGGGQPMTSGLPTKEEEEEEEEEPKEKQDEKEKTASEIKPSPVESEKKKEQETKKAAPVAEKRTPFVKRPSHAHLNAPSPIPDPLQISKPESRLDLPFTPEVNVYDLQDKYVVVLALPGASSKSFKVDYHPSSHELLIKGNVIDRLGIEEKYLKITEIKYGAFERTVKFPVLPRIKDDEIKAKYSNGLLQICVPKIKDSSEKPAPKKRIAIIDVPDEELEFEKNPNPEQKI